MQSLRFRQGDVLLTSELLSGNSLGAKQPHLILAHGEVTGHKHQITEGQAELYKKDGVLFLKDGLKDDVLFLQVFSETATLSHEEHKAIQIPCGVWMVRIQREYTPQLNKQWDHVSD
jgi:hypothetical protein